MHDQARPRLLAPLPVRLHHALTPGVSASAPHSSLVADRALELLDLAAPATYSASLTLPRLISTFSFAPRSPAPSSSKPTCDVARRRRIAERGDHDALLGGRGAGAHHVERRGDRRAHRRPGWPPIAPPSPRRSPWACGRPPSPGRRPRCRDRSASRARRAIAVHRSPAAFEPRRHPPPSPRAIWAGPRPSPAATPRSRPPAPPPSRRRASGPAIGRPPGSRSRSVGELHDVRFRGRDRGPVRKTMRPRLMTPAIDGGADADQIDGIAGDRGRRPSAYPASRLPTDACAIERIRAVDRRGGERLLERQPHRRSRRASWRTASTARIRRRD